MKRNDETFSVLVPLFLTMVYRNVYYYLKVVLCLMRVLKLDKKHHFLQVQVNVAEDLWYLSLIIEKGDIVSGKSERKVKLDNGEVFKKPFFPSIAVERIEYTPSQLRLLGKVVSEHDDVPKGSFHTLDVSLHDVVKITKEHLSQFVLVKLEESQVVAVPVLLVAFDRDEVGFGLLKSSGVEFLDSFSGEVEKKQFKVAVRNDFYALLVARMVEYDARFSPSLIVLASPAFFKDDVLSLLQRDVPVLAKKVVTVGCNQAGAAGVQEVVKRDELKRLLEKYRVVEESSLVDEVFAEVGKQGKVAYGLDLVESAALAGAVRVVVVAEQLVMDAREDGWYHRLDAVLRAVADSGGHVVIVGNHDAGKRLLGLTGIAALLRYRLE